MDMQLDLVADAKEELANLVKRAKRDWKTVPTCLMGEDEIRAKVRNQVCLQKESQEGVHAWRSARVTRDSLVNSDPFASVGVAYDVMVGDLTNNQSHRRNA